MSIVLNVVSPTASWLMSDGLALDRKTGRKVDSAFRKFEPLHKRLYIGYTGVRELATDVVTNLKRLYPHLETATIESAASASIMIIKEIQKHFDVSGQFLFTGISDRGTFASSVVRPDLSIETFIPTNTQLRTVVLYNQSCDDLANNIHQYIQKGFKADQAIQKGMAYTVNQVALKDPSVNRTTFFEVIHL